MTFATHLDELSSADKLDFQRITAGLRALSFPAASSGLADRILQAVKTEAETEKVHFRKAVRIRPFGPSWWGVGIAASVLILGSIVVTKLSSLRRQALPGGGNDIAWLASTQEADGTWSPARHGGSEAYRPALTALAALALASNSPAASAPSVDSACRALAALQQKDGSFGGSGRVKAYNNAVTAFALASLAPGHAQLRPVLDKTLATIAASQTSAGGWDYEAGSQGNTALTAWNLRALSEAEKQGFKEARVPLRKGLRWLRDVTRDNGTVVYHRNGPATHSESLLALTAYALMTAGEPFPGLPDIGRRIATSLSATGTSTLPVDSYRDYAKVLAFNAAGAPAKAAAVRAGWRVQSTEDAWGTIGGRIYTASLSALAREE